MDDNKEIIYPPCKKCGASHGMGIEDMKTGEITPLDLCRECLWEPFEVNFKKIQITLDDIE